MWLRWCSTRAARPWASTRRTWSASSAGSGRRTARIKRADKTLARRLEDVRAGYEAFTIVNHRDEIDAPSSPRGLAVKIQEEDLEKWVALALVRRGTRSVIPPRDRPSPRSQGVAAAARRFEPIGRDRKLAVAAALVAFEESEHGPLRQAARELTPDRDAGALVRRNDFAFLLAVVFDQGVDFEQAWRAPLRLQERPGHLDLQRIVSDPDAVRQAVSTTPMLHRFPNKLARWVVSAADRVIGVYGGDAGTIWAGVTARELQHRLDAFAGISQKKAAMATMLLWRFLDMPIREMSGCDVAVDIHLRRVFLRSGLVERDSAVDMIEAARNLYPSLPGALDPPAWTVGRNWCRRTAPDCPACPLGRVCPKLLDRTTELQGV